jgi:plasmid stability protein
LLRSSFGTTWYTVVHVFRCGDVEMAKANLTVQLDDAVIKRARVVAAKRGTSVSALVARGLTELVEQDERYEDAADRARELIGRSIPRGGRSWRREDLYER